MSPDGLPDNLDAALDPVELAAADWLVQQDRGLTPAQEREFARWLRADARHGRMHARLRAAWGMLDRVPAEQFPLPRRRRLKLHWLTVPVAAAAAIALGFFVFRPGRQPETLPQRQSEVTEVGGFKTMNLPDGSVVALNSRSAVEVNFTPSERRVRLVRGEANFAVTKDASRPFIVRASGVDVRAVGTAFNVRLGPKAIEVLVTEGRVRVDDSASGRTLLADAPLPTNSGATTSPASQALLIAGQRVVLSIPNDSVASAAAPIESVGPEEIQRQLAWQSRTLDFSDEPLADVIAEFNRYNRHKLVIADSRLGAQRFGGKFPAHDYESLVSFLEANFGVVAERRDNQTILRLAQ